MDKSLYFVAREKYGSQTFEQYFKNCGNYVDKYMILSLALVITKTLKNIHRIGYIYNSLSLDSIILKDAIAGQVDDSLSI